MRCPASAFISVMIEVVGRNYSLEILLKPNNSVLSVHPHPTYKNKNMQVVVWQRTKPSLCFSIRLYYWHSAVSTRT